MTIVDLNVLLYAVNGDAPQHAAARAWWEGLVNGGEPVGLPWVVVLGFLRIATNARVFAAPLSSEEAVARVDAWLGRENVRLIHERPDHWDVLKSLLDASGTGGNLTTDAHLAALAITYDAVLASTDADFSRFDGVRRVHPLRAR